MSLEREVLKRIRPTKQQDEKVRKAVQALDEKVLEEARARDVHIETMLVGSVAKGTHLRGPDIDLFMLFPESTSLEALKKNGLEIGRAVIGGREHYAQHPYVRGEFKGFQVDLVPCFRIRDTRQRMSAVDRTPFHTQFVKSNLAPSMADEVRLLKRFMKGVGCYGAEAKVQGFSGYLCELLILKFGSFQEVTAAAHGWNRGEHLALPDHPGDQFDEPLTFVDPVDSSRNVASAVSLETMLRFISACRAYTGSPSTKFFFPEDRETWTGDRITKVAGERLKNTIALVMPTLDLIDDVLWPQLRKTMSSVIALLHRNEFEVESSSIDVIGKHMYLMVELRCSLLDGEMRHRGPPSIADQSNVREFLSKWNDRGISKPFEENGRWYVIARREYPSAEELVRARFRTLRLGKDIQGLEDVEVFSGRKLLEDGHLEALTAHFDSRMPWEVED